MGGGQPGAAVAGAHRRARSDVQGEATPNSGIKGWASHNAARDDFRRGTHHKKPAPAHYSTLARTQAAQENPRSKFQRQDGRLVC